MSPYVVYASRLHIDVNVACLATTIKLEAQYVGEQELTAQAGLLNYAITKLILNFLGEPSYWKLALIKGVLTDIQDEFNRRVVVPYEETKREANGDVY